MIPPVAPPPPPLAADVSHLEPVLKAQGAPEHQRRVLAQAEPSGGRAALHGGGVVGAQALDGGQPRHKERGLRRQAGRQAGRHGGGCAALHVIWGGGQRGAASGLCPSRACLACQRIPPQPSHPPTCEYTVSSRRSLGPSKQVCSRSYPSTRLAVSSIARTAGRSLLSCRFCVPGGRREGVACAAA